MNDFAAFIYGFQFHYDLILLLHGFMLPLMKLYFNFIMILFYLKSIKKYGWKAMLFQFHYDLILFTELLEYQVTLNAFQFHYDLILFGSSSTNAELLPKFQFHYDLILLCNTFLNPCIITPISISL